MTRLWRCLLAGSKALALGGRNSKAAIEHYSQIKGGFCADGGVGIAVLMGGIVSD